MCHKAHPHQTALAQSRQGAAEVAGKCSQCRGFSGWGEGRWDDRMGWRPGGGRMVLQAGCPGEGGSPDLADPKPYFWAPIWIITACLGLCLPNSGPRSKWPHWGGLCLQTFPCVQQPCTLHWMQSRLASLFQHRLRLHCPSKTLMGFSRDGSSTQQGDVASVAECLANVFCNWQLWFPPHPNF